VRQYLDRNKVGNKKIIFISFDPAKLNLKNRLIGGFFAILNYRSNFKKNYVSFPPILYEKKYYLV